MSPSRSVELISSSRRSSIRASMSYSAIPAARSCRSTIRCSSRMRCATSWCARKGAPSMPPKATPARPGGSGGAGDERPGGDQCGDRPHRRADGFGADRLPDRAGADASDRQRRLPGSRHDRDHPACTKHNYLVKDVADLGAPCMRRFTSPRAGGRPVVVDLPKDILFAPRSTTGWSSSATRAIARKSRPTGAGCRGGGDDRAAKRRCFTAAAADQFRSRGLRAVYEFVRMVDAPCTLTLMGLGAFRRAIRISSACSACTACTNRTWRCTIAI